MIKKLFLALLFQPLGVMANAVDKEFSSHSLSVTASTGALVDGMTSLEYGYRFTPNFGVGVIGLQGSSSSASGSDDEFSAVGLNLLASNRFARNWSIYSRLGITSYSSSFIIDPRSATGERQREDGVGLLVDLGAEFHFTFGLGLGFGYRYQDKGDSSIDPAPLFFDIIYHF